MLAVIYKQNAGSCLELGNYFLCLNDWLVCAKWLNKQNEQSSENGRYKDWKMGIFYKN